MKALVAIGLGIVAVVSIILGMAYFQPDDFKISRSTVIKAAPNEVFPHMNDFRNFGAWSPWEAKDPAMKKTFAGAEAGKGSIYSWEGNSEVGSGSMTILESEADRRVYLQLDFMTPMPAQHFAEYLMEPEAEETKVTWTMIGKHGFIGRIFGVFMSMEKMVGPDFEKGLASLKSVVEASKTAPAQAQ